MYKKNVFKEVVWGLLCTYSANLYDSVALLLVIRDDTVCTFKVVITGGAMLCTLAPKQTLPSPLFRRNTSVVLSYGEVTLAGLSQRVPR